MASSALPVTVPAGNSRFAYVYNFCADYEETHPKMGSALWLIPWPILGGLGGAFGTLGLLIITKLLGKLGDVYSAMILMGVASLNALVLSVWNFPPQLCRLGSTRKIILEMVALWAAMLAKHFSDRNLALVYFLPSLTTLIYAHIKHSFAVYDINLGGVFLTALTQTLLYWIPYSGSIPLYLCFAAYSFWTTTCNDDDDHQSMSAAAAQTPPTSSAKEEKKQQVEKKLQQHQQPPQLLAITTLV